jgi:AraC family transcriptional regulator, exoenzyme S synthesis regulatory protein ExsA
MIIYRQQLKIENQCVVERLLIVPPFRMEAVFPNEACFLHFKEGEVLIKAPTEKWHLLRKESVLLKCGHYFADFISQAPAATWEVYAVHLHPAILKEIYQGEISTFIHAQKQPPFVQKLPPQDIIDRFIDSLLFYLDHPQLASEELLRLKVKELILLLLQTTNADHVLGLVSALFSPRKATVQEVIHAHLYSDLSLAELARLSALSLSSFKREFQKMYRDSPGNYIRNKRLERAKEILQYTDFSVSEVAYQVGFNDPAYFARAFHRRYLCAPSDFRKKLQP